MSDERIFEEYRNRFLEFLDAAERLLKLQTDIAAIDRYLKMYASGWNINDGDYAVSLETAFRASKVLLDCLGSEYLASPDLVGDLNKCRLQLDAERAVLSTAADFCWRQLVKAVKQIWVYDDGTKAWGRDQKSYKKMFQYGDDEAGERIHFFKKTLSRTDGAPAAPYWLPIEYKLYRNELFFMVPKKHDS